MRLDCPLCGAVVHDGEGPPAPGGCPSCGARFDGGGERPQDAAAATLSRLGFSGDADGFARALFATDHAPSGVAVTSDRRDGFYAWWIFWRPDAEPLIVELATPPAEG